MLSSQVSADALAKLDELRATSRKRFPLLALARTMVNDRLRVLVKHKVVWDALTRPCLNEQPPARPLRGVPLDVERRMRWIYLARALTKKPTLYQDELTGLRAAYLAAIAANNAPAKPTQVPRVRFGEITPQEFRERFIDNRHPVVIEGYEHTAGTWTLDRLVEHYGDVPQLLANTKRRFMFEGALRDVMQDEDLYLHNSTTVFERDPQMLAALRLDKAQELSGLAYMQVQQLFVRMKAGPGAPFHCEHNDNFVFSLAGEKKWTFVDPAFSFLMYADHSPHGGVAAAYVKGRLEENTDAYPLYKYCPRMETTLKPGDVLYNPLWWWHAAWNVTDRAVSVSTRWHNNGPVKRNPNVLFSITDMLSPMATTARLRMAYRIAAGKNPNYMIGKWPMWETFAHSGYFSRLNGKQT